MNFRLTVELNERSTTVHSLETRLRRHRSLSRDSTDGTNRIRDSIERGRMSSSNRTDGSLHLSTDNINASGNGRLLYKCYEVVLFLLI